MNEENWIALSGMISTFLLSIVTLLVNARRESNQRERDDKNQKERDDREERKERERSDRQLQLQIATKKYELQYSKLQEKRVDAISEIHSLIRDIEGANIRLIHCLQFSKLNEDIEKANDELLEQQGNFLHQFKPKKLYFSKSLSDRIENVVRALSDVSEMYTLYDDEPDRLKMVEQALKAQLEKQESIDAVLSEIENEFRLLIGSEDKKEANTESSR